MDEFEKLVRICYFNGDSYIFPDGLPMGGPLSSLLADIFMDRLEQWILKFGRHSSKALLWYQFVDDIFGEEWKALQWTTLIRSLQHSSLITINQLMQLLITWTEYSQCNFWSKIGIEICSPFTFNPLVPFPSVDNLYLCSLISCLIHSSFSSPFPEFSPTQ